MQGRLSEPIENKIQSFPKNTWKEEFKKATECGFTVIEWIFDLYEKNPIMDNSQILDIKSIAEEYNVKINSLCADYFMEKKLFNETEINIKKNLDILSRLIEKCSRIGISIIEIPLVDSSSLKTKTDEDSLVHNLNSILSHAYNNGINIVLETDLSSDHFKSLLSQFDYPNVFANYDTGNSSALGYNVTSEFTMLSDKIKNIHIKDRLFKGKSVPLGTGDTNFDSFFYNLENINFKGDLIIQGAREEHISPMKTCVKYYNFVKQYLDKYFLATQNGKHHK